MEITATKEEIKLEMLAPSEGSANQHSYRVYLQVMDWKFLEEAHYDPLDWGWTLRGNIFHPIYTDEPVKPDDLLKFIRCKCKISTKNPCSTNCSCKKNGLYCVAACGNCRGDGCENENPKNQIIDDFSEESDDRNIFDIFNNVS